MQITITQIDENMTEGVYTSPHYQVAYPTNQDEQSGRIEVIYSGLTDRAIPFGYVLHRDKCDDTYEYYYDGALVVMDDLKRVLRTISRKARNTLKFS